MRILIAGCGYFGSALRHLILQPDPIYLGVDHEPATLITVAIITVAITTVAITTVAK